MFGFYTGMMIVSFNTLPLQKSHFTFGAKAKLPKLKALQTPVSDVVEISAKKENLLPRKFEFTEFEEKCNELLVKRDRMNMNIRTQKQNLRYFYTAQDNYDYHEMLKQRQNLMGQLRRLAKNAGVNSTDLELGIYAKREYNRYAPKIYRAATHEELNQLQNLITSLNLFSQAEELLKRLIAQRRALL